MSLSGSSNDVTHLQDLPGHSFDGTARVRRNVPVPMNLMGTRDMHG